MHFIFVTRCFTPKNIPIIRENLRDTFNDVSNAHTYFHVIIVDCTHGATRKEFEHFADRNTCVVYQYDKFSKDTYMAYGIDEALKQGIMGTGDEYVYILDDDNLLHPNFLEVAEYAQTGTFDAIVFKVKDHPEWGNPDIMCGRAVGRIDWSNYITKLSVMRNLKVYSPTLISQQCDGTFFEKLINNGYAIKFLDKELGRNNALPKP